LHISIDVASDALVPAISQANANPAVASTINLAAPLDTRANGAMLPIGAGGKISCFSKSGSDLLADASGCFLG
jgi:hypothetical protein